MRIPYFESARILVVGDVMLDRYWYGDTSRISPEAPVPVVRIQQTEDRLGGAANVAHNITAMGGCASLVGVIGEDENAHICKQLLKNANIKPCLVESPLIPTITKLRVIGRSQQLLRLDFEGNIDRYVETQDILVSLFDKNLSQYTVVILSDYHKGVLNNISDFIHKSKRLNKIVLIDPKNNNFDLYAGADLVTPNRLEFEAVVGTCQSDSDFEEKGFNLLEKTRIKNLLITRGQQGMSLLMGETKKAVHIPTKAREVYDVTGAGDTVIAVMGLAMSQGLDWVQAAHLANIAAGCVVAKLGTSIITAQELQLAVDGVEQENSFSQAKLLTQQQAIEKTNTIKIQNKRVVFTNGCFDILHPGHIAYLEEAKSLGHYLIVGLNTDISVKRLKGETRPIHNEMHRAQVLAGLGCVDAVVFFSEDTPEQLITALLPDVLVKGGDYTIESIVGSQAILNNGGEVKVLQFVQGYSTTESINTIKIKSGEAV